MLVVGLVGWGPKLHYTKLTADEQYTHMSLWAMLASPLLIGCDLARMDEFTRSLLTNDKFSAEVPPHGVILLKLYPGNTKKNVAPQK